MLWNFIFFSRYYIEKKDEGKDTWTKVKSSTVPDTHYTVQNLTKNAAYEFRVIAENRAGQSPPSEPSSKVVAKLPYGKSAHQQMFVVIATTQS